MRQHTPPRGVEQAEQMPAVQLGQGNSRVDWNGGQTFANDVLFILSGGNSPTDAQRERFARPKGDPDAK